MNKVIVFERKKEKQNTFIINIEDIKHIKNNIELSLDILINKITKAIEKESFEEGLEYIKLAKKIEKKNPKINSLEFILKGKMLISQYNEKYYNLLFLEEDLNSLIKSISYLDEIESTDLYKETFFKVKDLRNKISEENIKEKLENEFKEVKDKEAKEFLLFVKDVFKNKYENNFYNSMELKHNIIENNINISDFNKLRDFLEETYLLYKFNLEENINRQVDILVKLDINEIFIIDYTYINYLMNIIGENKYKTLEELKKDITKVYNEISTFNKMYIPV